MTDSVCKHEKEESSLDFHDDIYNEIDCLPHSTTEDTKWMYMKRKVTADVTYVGHGAMLIGKTNMHELGIESSKSTAAVFAGVTDAQEVGEPFDEFAYFGTDSLSRTDGDRHLLC